MLTRIRAKLFRSPQSAPAGTLSRAIHAEPRKSALGEPPHLLRTRARRDEHESKRHEDFLRGVHGEPGHLGVLRRRRGDVRVVRSEVRARRGKHGEQAETASLSSRFASAAGPESRDATGDETRGRLVSTRGPPLHLSNACSSASRPGTDPRALPPTPLYPTGSRSIHSANAVVAKHERVAFSANARPMCDICQVRLTATRRNTRAARRWTARGGARAVARRARRGRRRVATDSEFEAR